ncbi:MAG: hypothetical protein QOH27_4726, partial [Mycobacterium sp.]|nr:hypothetical protein [Mycobacterium sp.]
RNASEWAAATIFSAVAKSTVMP